jgi:transaldolase
MSHSALKIKLFADGADAAGMIKLASSAAVRGFTTNPTLMRKAGVSDYRAFAREVLAAIKDRPVCFEVLADDLDEMQRQALIIAAWADNVFVKVPVTNSRGESTGELIRSLAARGVKVNVTAVMTLEQLQGVAVALNPSVQSYVSVFAGRIADTGVDPCVLIKEAVRLLEPLPRTELIWASTREIFNIFQAEAAGCGAITVPKEILDKLPLIGYDLARLSLDTVNMFYRDAQSAGYAL